MPRVTVPDKSVGDTFSEAMWDTYIRDNFNIGSLTPIADAITSGSPSTIDFTSIPSSFAHLMLQVYLRNIVPNPFSGMTFRLNNDSTAVYDQTFQYASGTGAQNIVSTESLTQSNGYLGLYVGNQGPANSMGVGTLYLPNYTSTVFSKEVFGFFWARAGNTTGNMYQGTCVNFWRPVTPAAITQVTLIAAASTFVTGSRATLYGIPYI